MNIKLNGYMCVNNDEYYFEDLEIKVDEDIDIPFDDIDDFGISGFDKIYDDEDDYTEACDSDWDGNCYDCEYGDEDDDDDDEIDFDLDNDERFDDYSRKYKMFLSEYINRIYSSCGCPYCVCEILDEFRDNVLEEFA